jgi:hypothetical protein
MQVDDYWDPGKKMLADAKGLLESMFSFDKDNIPEKIITKVQPYIENEDFTPKKIESVSKACTAMCQWVRAMNKYHFVARDVEPKRIALKASQEELDVLTQVGNPSPRLSPPLPRPFPGPPSLPCTSIHTSTCARSRSTSFAPT